MAGTALTELHRTFEAAYNDGDLDRALALYAPEVRMATQDGGSVTGLDAAREQLEVLWAMRGHMVLRTRFVLEGDDLALMSCDWTLTVGHESVAAVTAEVARRQRDGAWAWVLDDPFASLHGAAVGAAGA